MQGDLRAHTSMNQCFKLPVHVPAGKRASPSLVYITGEIEKPNILDCKYWPNQISKTTYIPTNLPRNTIIDIVVALNPPQLTSGPPLSI